VDIASRAVSQLVENGIVRGPPFNGDARPDAALLPFPSGLRVALVGDVVLEGAELRGRPARRSGGLIFRSISSILVLRVGSASSLISLLAEIPWHWTGIAGSGRPLGRRISDVL
jgi:hypothetical protein